jgi:hypothetical protein
MGIQGQSFGYDNSTGILQMPIVNQFGPGFDPRTIVASASHEDLTQTGNLAYANIWSQYSSATAELARVSTELESLRCVAHLLLVLTHSHAP